MDRRQKEQVEAYGRIKAFLAEHPLEAPARYGAPQRMLEEVIARLGSHLVTQSEGRRQFGAGTLRLRALHRELREGHLRPIAAIARAVMHQAPGIGIALRLPGYRLGPTRLLAEAQAMRNAVAPYAASFVENGRPVDFLEQVDAAVAALHRCLVERGTRKGERVGAGKAIDAEIRRGRNAVHMLDAIVRAQFAADPYVLAKWQSARRLMTVPASGAPDAPKQASTEAA